MTKVRVRYAPSPTGIPHIGNIRTALFNFLFAKNQKGDFYLRIEDTDQARMVKGAIEKIKQSLKLLGINWDNEIIIQSQRLPIYNKYLEKLKDLGLAKLENGAWRFIIPKGNRKISWIDAVHDQVTYPLNVIEDFIIYKSDGFPTYHFASTVDDHEMQISHVFRGDEWIPSTPKHLLIYEALGWQPPKFVHLPPILGHNKKKLSKREGAKSVIEYIDEGYLPEALINFLAFLGWSPKGERELYSLKELIGDFSLDRINKNSPVFNIEKLNWFNKKYINSQNSNNLLPKILKVSKYANSVSTQKLEQILDLTKDRLKTLTEFDTSARIFFEKGNQHLPSKDKIKQAKLAIQSINTWNQKFIENHLEAWIKKNNLNPSDFKNTLRLAIFADNTPPIYQSMALLSKKEVLERLEDSLKKSR